MQLVTDNKLKSMNIKDTLLSKKFKRKNFLIYFAASAVAVYSLIKLPLRSLFSFNEEPTPEKHNPIKVSQNPNAVSRNSRGSNG